MPRCQRLTLPAAALPCPLHAPVLRRYGAIVLAVEILGALAMLPYGLCLVMRVTNGAAPPVDAKGLNSTGLPYHIRVMIPCYKEPLEVVTKTVMAALFASVPEGCCRTGACAQGTPLPGWLQRMRPWAAAGESAPWAGGQENKRAWFFREAPLLGPWGTWVGAWPCRFVRLHLPDACSLPAG